MSEQRVVIYGGGMAGAMLAKRLSADLDVTLVDPHDYFEVPMAAPRNLVDGGAAMQAIVPFSQALPRVRHVHGALVELTSAGGVVKSDSGTRTGVDGTVQVLATGSRYANSLMRAPTGTAPERMAFYQRFRERLAASQRILIIGGGPIGIEVAGEITQEYPSKSVTIVEAGERVLGGTSRKMADHATAVLEKRGVRIFTGERLKGAGSASGDVFAPGGEAHTESGRVLPYDLAIWCVGGRPNTDYMEQYFAHVLDHDRRIQVTPQLRVKGYDRLFALGDITDLAENKMAWHVAGQVDCAAINVRRVLAGRTSADQLQSYRPQTGNPAMVVTLGRRAGVICLPRIGMVKAGWFNRKVKAAHMLVPKYRKLLGV